MAPACFRQDCGEPISMLTNTVPERAFSQKFGSGASKCHVAQSLHISKCGFQALSSDISSTQQKHLHSCAAWSSTPLAGMGLHGDSFSSVITTYRMTIRGVPIVPQFFFDGWICVAALSVGYEICFRYLSISSIIIWECHIHCQRDRLQAIIPVESGHLTLPAPLAIHALPRGFTIYNVHIYIYPYLFT